jgi:hypothetical protein
MSPPIVTRPRSRSPGDHRDAADPALYRIIRASKIAPIPYAIAISLRRPRPTSS